MRLAFATTLLWPKRIEELQVRNERKAEMAALSRDELIGILAEIVHASPCTLYRMLACLMVSKPRRCWRRCADGMSLSR